MVSSKLRLLDVIKGTKMGTLTEGRPKPPPKPMAKPTTPVLKEMPRIPSRPYPPVPKRPAVAQKPLKQPSNGLNQSTGEPPTTGKVPPPLPSVPPCASIPEGQRTITPPPRTPTPPSDKVTSSTANNDTDKSPKTVPQVPKKPSLPGMVRVLPLELIKAMSKENLSSEDDALPSKNPEEGGASSQAVEDIAEKNVDPNVSSGKMKGPTAPTPIEKGSSSIAPKPLEKGSSSSDPQTLEKGSSENLTDDITANQVSGSPISHHRVLPIDTRRSESPIPPNTVLISNLKPGDLRKNKPPPKPGVKPKPQPHANSSQFYVGLNDSVVHITPDDSNGKGNRPVISKRGKPSKPKKECDKTDMVVCNSENTECTSTSSKSNESVLNDSKFQSSVGDQHALCKQENGSNEDYKDSPSTERESIVKKENVESALSDDISPPTETPFKPPRKKKHLKSKSQDSINQESIDKESKVSQQSSPSKSLIKQDNIDMESNIVVAAEHHSSGKDDSRPQSVTPRDEKVRRLPSRKAPAPPKISKKKVLINNDHETSPNPYIDPNGTVLSNAVVANENSVDLIVDSSAKNVADVDPNNGSSNIKNMAAFLGDSINKGLKHQLTDRTRPKPKPKPKPPLLKPRPKLRKSLEGDLSTDEKASSDKPDAEVQPTENANVDRPAKPSETSMSALVLSDDKQRDSKYGRNSSYSKALDEDDSIVAKTAEHKTDSLKRSDSYTKALDDVVIGDSSKNTEDMDSSIQNQNIPSDFTLGVGGNTTASVDNEEEVTEELATLKENEAIFIPPPPPEKETETKMLQFPSESEGQTRLSQQIPIALLDDQVFHSELDNTEESIIKSDNEYEDVEFKRDSVSNQEDGENIYEPPPDLPPKNKSCRQEDLAFSTPPNRPPKRKSKICRQAPPVPLHSPPMSPQNSGSPPLPPRCFMPKSHSFSAGSEAVSMQSRSRSDIYDTEGYLEPMRKPITEDVYSYADLPDIPNQKSSSPKVLKKRPEIGSPPKEITRSVSECSLTSVRTSGGSHIYEPVVSRPNSVSQPTGDSEPPTGHRISGNSIFYYGIRENNADTGEVVQEKASEEPVAVNPPCADQTKQSAAGLDTPIPVPRAPPRLRRRQTIEEIERVQQDQNVEPKSDDDEDSDSSDDYIIPDDPDFVKPENSIYLKDSEVQAALKTGASDKDEEVPVNVPSEEVESIYHEADESTETEGIYHEAEGEGVYNEADDSAVECTSNSTSGVASPEAGPPIPPRDHHRSEPVPHAILQALQITRSTSTVSDSRFMPPPRANHPTKTVSFQSNMADSGLSLSPSSDDCAKSPGSEGSTVTSPGREGHGVRGHEGDRLEVASQGAKLRSISVSSPNIGLRRIGDRLEDPYGHGGRPCSWGSSGDGYEDPRELRSGSFRQAVDDDQTSLGSDQLPINTSHGSNSSINSDASDSDDEEQVKERAEKRKRKLAYIAREILSSEESFVDVLKLLNIDFRVAVTSATASKEHAVVPSSVMNQILQYLPQLHNFNEDLLKDLRHRLNNWNANPRISDIFVRKGPFLKMYTFYIREFENSLLALDDARKKYPEFDAAVRDFEASLRCKNLFIKHYMLKPIQRIPQYKLLLQDYLKYLRPDHADYKDTKTALAIVSEVADHANQSMAYGDNFKKLWEIQSALIGQFEVIKPGREFLKEGVLNKLSRKVMQPRMFLLFSDVMLYTTPVSAGYKLNNQIPLTGMRVSKPTKEDFQNEFSILSTQRSFTISASTPEERDEWLTALQNAIKENAKRRSSFDVRKHQNLSTNLNTSMNEVEYDYQLGQRAPVWVPDARVSMCMLCTAEFSVTFRRHHCRACGKVVCGFCSDYRAPLRYLMYKATRVCIECYHKLSKDFDETDSVQELSSSFDADREGSFSRASIKQRFRGISWGSYRKASKAKRPKVLQEVSANDEAAEMSGYLKIWRTKKWKKLWFVLKGKIFYTYKASEDSAAIESMVLLGYEVSTFNSWFEGVEPSLVFELAHKGTPPMVFRTESSSSRDKWLQAMRQATMP